MRFTQTAEYALRALTHMATTESDVPYRAADLSEATGIPIHYLSKIMRRLVSAGLLESQKGHGGGFRFARSLKKIRFADVLEAVDYETEPSTCVFGWGECSPANPCPLHPFWSRLKDDFAEWAHAHTLDDVRTGGLAA